jgi:hypothetical protein
LLLVAYKGTPHPADWSRLANEPLRSELRRVGLGSAEEFQLRRIGGPATLRNLVRLTAVPAHSDYFPTVTLEGPRARFKRESADYLVQVAYAGVPIQEMLSERIPPPASAGVADTEYSLPSNIRKDALGLRRALMLGHVDDGWRRRWGRDADAVDTLLELSSTRIEDQQLEAWSAALALVSAKVNAGLPKRDVMPLFDRPAWVADISAQSSAVQELLALQASIAARDAVGMSVSAHAVLARPSPRISTSAREQALVAAMLSAIARGHAEEVQALESDHGQSIPPSVRFGELRSWLLAWADGIVSRSTSQR